MTRHEACRILLSCTICIFLSAASSSKLLAAGDPARTEEDWLLAAGGPARTEEDWLLEAALCEKRVWAAASPTDANAALVAKSACYAAASHWKEAAGTLGRVRMYLLSPIQRTDVLYSKGLYSHLAGDISTASAVCSELEVLPEGLSPEALRAIDRLKSDVAASAAGHDRAKNETVATLLALIPGFGHFYCGAWGEGLLSQGLNACSIAWVVTQIASGCYISGIVGGAIALNYTYMGGIERAATLANQ